MKHWKSNWIITVAIIHTIYAIVVFKADYLSLYENNIVSSITSAHVGLAVWFFLFGQVLFIVGQLMRSYEKETCQKIPNSIGINLLALTLLGVIIMPASGFWLMFPPVMALLIEGKKKSGSSPLEN